MAFLYGGKTACFCINAVCLFIVVLQFDYNYCFLAYYRYYSTVWVSFNSANNYYVTFNLSEMFLGIKSRMFGHRLDFDDRCVLLMNHRCHFDWLFFFSVMAKQGELIYWTVIQRRINKFVPILGMQIPAGM